MVYEIEPGRDPRWAAFLSQGPRGGSVFHTPGWLRALEETYGYRTSVLTTSGPGEGAIRNGLPVCRVSSWATGRRAVSLPFSDYCDVLGEEGTDELAAGLRAIGEAERLRYVEMRPALCGVGGAGFGVSQRFWRHAVDLRGGEAAVYQRLHADHIRRKIRRAERERIEVREGRGDTAAVDAFYRLFTRTRRRHGYPPPPRVWFANVLRQMGEAASLRVAYRANGEAIGTMMLLWGRDTVYYKYGASDERHHALGAMPLLFWDVMREAIGRGLAALDLGRSDLQGAGLIEFKERLGGERAEVVYWRSPAADGGSSGGGGGSLARRVFSSLPESLLPAVGSLLYRHIG
ncbi:hypothetical protein F183_A54540 (plasmid) [Bryobacterales bacterium F-183]|nr:hypothetical protein F183_A54540 [Bryobacterales bacterium F-183]